MRRKCSSLHPRKLAALTALSLLLLHPACKKGPPDPSLAYGARIQAETDRLEAVAGARLPLGLRLTNIGQNAWDSADTPPCFLSYHLMSQDRDMIRFDNRRIALPRRIEPGDEVELDVVLRIPLQSGSYLLEFDLVREGVAWFKDGGSGSLEVPLDVTQRRWPDSGQEIDLEHGGTTRFTSSLPGIDELYTLIRLTLEENETTFSGRTGEISGFAPGRDYPQIWLRDAATILPASRYFYDAPWLSSWLEEHLAFQREDGSLYDWIDSRGGSDKNTTETDQEASAVQAAYQIYQILGSDWLRKDIAGRMVIERLETALEFVRRERWDPDLLMVKGAHTADWGDVDIVDAGQNAVYTDENTHWTVDIYDQSMFYQAVLELAGMLDSLGETSRAASWRAAAGALRDSTLARLWREDRGFFVVHRHLDDMSHGFDEDDIFAMGGNTQAVLSGLAGPLRTRHIIETALARQATHEVSTISGTLLPPYPAGTFRHPMLDDPFEYQNGAQWDWFGGKLIYALYQNGYSRAATQKLQEIIRKNIANRGFFEWDNREGVGMGSDSFCGSAGSLAKAVIEGYFGISIEGGSLELEISLGRDSGMIHLNQPSEKTFLAYEYRFDEEAGRIIFRYNSNLSHPRWISILSPWGDTLTLGELEKRIRITSEDRDIPFEIAARNLDVFIRFHSPRPNHMTEIIFDSPSNSAN